MVYATKIQHTAWRTKKSIRFFAKALKALLYMTKICIFALLYKN